MRSVFILSVCVCILTCCTANVKRHKVRHPHNMFGKRGFSWHRTYGDINQNHSDEKQNNFSQDLKVTSEEEEKVMLQRKETARSFLARLIKEKQKDLPVESDLN